jgi:F0F1-type ATP synthase assembly protein I
MEEKAGSAKAGGKSQRSAKAAALDQSITVLSYLIGGVAFYGLLGWLGDHFLHTRFLLPIGIILGAGLAIYTIIKRFGQPPPVPPSKADRDDDQ